MAKYKGDTLGKKLGRAWFWFSAKQFHGQRFFEGKHLVLASREGGDIEVLRSMGVKSSNIVAVEMNPDDAQECSERTQQKVWCGRVQDVVRKFRGQLITAHLDLCHSRIELAAEVAVPVVRFGMQNRTLLSIGLAKGHDPAVNRLHSEALEAATCFLVKHEELQAQRLGSHFPQDLVPVSAETWKEILRWEAKHRSRNPRRAWEQRMMNTRKHVQALESVVASKLNVGGPCVTIRALPGSVGYTSQVPGKGICPFAFCMFRVFRAPSESVFREELVQHGQSLREAEEEVQIVEPEIYESSEGFHAHHFFRDFGGVKVCRQPMEFGVGSHSSMVALSNYFDDAPGALRVPSRSLAAWKAHVSRGTYRAA